MSRPGQQSKDRVDVQRGSNPSRFAWPERLARLLGTMPDAKLAAKAGISPATVFHERQRRGIPPFRSQAGRRRWTADEIALLGTASDRRVAAMLGVSPFSVARKRRILGIPPFGKPGLHAREWSEREVALLGTAPDREVGDQLGLSHVSVAIKRKSLGIPAFRPVRRPVEWTDEMVELLGQVSDVEVGGRFDVHPKTVQLKRETLGIPAAQGAGALVRSRELVRLLRTHPSAEVRRRTGLPFETIKRLRDELGIEAPPFHPQRWTPEVLARLGRDPDRSIARDLGITPAAVLGKRRRLGIPPAGSARPWTPEEEALLGTAPDGEIARRLGRTYHAVRYRRSQLGIPIIRSAPRPTSS